MNTPNQISNAHDNFVRKVMSDPRVSRDFFEAHLPQEILRVTDLTQLTLEPTSHIDELRKEAVADLLYKTVIDGHVGYLYLLVEHQSSADVLMPFRVLKYITHAIDHHLTETQSKLIPLVYPLVIYHDKVPYPYSTDIKDLVDCPRELVDAFFLKPFHLIDLGKIEDAELKKRTWAGVMEFVLKHIFARDMLPHIRDIMGLLRELEQAGGQNFVSIVLQYVIDRGEFSNENEMVFLDLVKNELFSETGDKVMTLAEKLIAKGVEKVAIRLLAEGIDLNLIAKVTSLPLERIKELRAKSEQ